MCIRLIVHALMQDLPEMTQQVAELVARDCSEAEIGQELGLGREVVRRHKRAIRKRLESVRADWGEA